MSSSKDCLQIFPSTVFIEKKLPGRTIAKLDLESGEIHFNDGSILVLTWHPDHLIGIELLESTSLYYKDDEPLSSEDIELIQESWRKLKDLDAHP